MLHKHTFTLVYRSFLRYKSSFFINLGGLSTGLACALLIYLWVADETGMNKYNAQDARLYQIMENSADEVNGVRTGAGTQGILAEGLAAEIPEIEVAASVVPASWFTEKGVLTSGQNKVKTSAQYVSKDYFKLFTIEFIQGNAANALTDKYSMALSEEMAIKLFQSPENSIGKRLEWMDGIVPASYHVTAVYRNPINTTTPCDLMVNYEIFLDNHDWLKGWDASDPHTFVLLRKNESLEKLNGKIKLFLQTKNKAAKNTLVAQRYSENYLYGRFENGLPAGGRIEYVRLFTIIAVFILAIACINFMNLSTARASRRMKEIGVKKTVGATRNALMIQHLEESMIMVFLSTLIALTVVVLLLPQFNSLTGKHLSLRLSYSMVLISFAMIVLTGVVAGSYPAVYLSAFRPVEVLKGKMRSSWSELWIRKGLVVFQFTVSIILIVGVVVVYRQISYVQTRNLGYNRENILRFDAGFPTSVDPEFFAEGGAYEKQMETFMSQVRAVPGVVEAANFEHDLTGHHGGLGGVDWREGTDDDNTHFNNLEVGLGFIETLSIKIKEGRSFSPDRPNERSKVIFNEEAIKAMGLTDPIGKVIKVWGQQKEIIGVAKDFNMESLFEQIRPTIIQFEPRSTKVMVKIQAGQQTAAVEALRALFRERNPGLVFDYSFIDDDYQAMYVSELRVSVLSRYFAGLAVLISTLGLFGLSAFMAEVRTKEIGIRKILGSKNSQIVYLLSSDFIKLIMLSVLIALPVSYIAANNWLATFAYSIQLKWWFFAVAALLAAVVPLLTIGWQTYRAATANAVDCLTSE